MNRRGLLGRIALAGPIALGASMAKADALADITQRGTIRIAVPQAFRPSAASAST